MKISKEIVDAAVRLDVTNNSILLKQPIELNERLNTPLGRSYWGQTGAYQTTYEALTSLLVPDAGEADTLNGELLRAIGSLFYEYCNNGNGNACDMHYETRTYTVDCTCSGEDPNCDDCCGTGQYEEDEEELDYTEVDKHYQRFINLLETEIVELKPVLDVICTIIRVSDYKDRKTYFGEENMNVYNQLVDGVIYYIINNLEPKVKPDYYKDETYSDKPTAKNVKVITTTKVKLSGENGNVFNLLGVCMTAMKKDNRWPEATEMQQRVWDSPSYDKALEIMREYCEIN